MRASNADLSAQLAVHADAQATLAELQTSMEALQSKLSQAVRDEELLRLENNRLQGMLTGCRWMLKGLHTF